MTRSPSGNANRHRPPRLRQYGELVLQKVPFARRAGNALKSLLIPNGPTGIRRVGHRRYVGGLWKELGRLQFEFLQTEGLQPHHYLLDVACGSLRGGVYFIPYLDAGHYLGIDKEETLIRAGIDRELTREQCELKNPRFVVSDSFEFHKFDQQCDFALAQSLIRDDVAFYATFFEARSPVSNPDTPCDQGYFPYSRAEMTRFGTAHGWRAEYVGDWGHPRGQVMVRYRPA
jgi:hypothetical protein